jgi:uncharacterized protein (TIGR03083 family)
LTSEPLDVLALCWETWRDVLAPLPPSAWEAPTRSTGWDVKSLVTHHAGWVLAFAGLRDRLVTDAAATTSAVDLLRGFNQPGGAATAGAADIERQTREMAATLTSEQLVGAFADVAPAAVAAARALGASAVVDYVGVASMTIAEVATIGVVEATVHGLDLLDAVGVPADHLPGAAFELVTGVLVALPGAVAFIEGATGRRPLFPLLR